MEDKLLVLILELFSYQTNHHVIKKFQESFVVFNNHYQGKISLKQFLKFYKEKLIEFNYYNEKFQDTFDRINIILEEKKMIDKKLFNKSFKKYF